MEHFITDLIETCERQGQRIGHIHLPSTMYARFLVEMKENFAYSHRPLVDVKMSCDYKNVRISGGANALLIEFYSKE